MIIECLLLSASLCHAVKDRPVLALALAQTATMTADGVTTEQSIRSFARSGQPSYETDPIARALLGRHPTWARMAPIGVAVIVLQTVAVERMHRSKTWLRYVWWVPQTLGIGANAWGIQFNAR